MQTKPTDRMLLHLLRMLAALLLPRGSVGQSGECGFLLAVPVPVALAVLLARETRLNGRHHVVPLLLHIREIDPFLRALSAQIRETGHLGRGLAADVRRAVVLAGM